MRNHQGVWLKYQSSLEFIIALPRNKMNVPKVALLTIRLDMDSEMTIEELKVATFNPKIPSAHYYCMFSQGRRRILKDTSRHCY